jgi:alpha-ketoglutarate-dependent taurine dioxygenase
MPTGPKFFTSVKREQLRLTQATLVKTGYLDVDRKFPLVMEPNIEGLNLITWAGDNRQFIDAELARHGAILFRNFNLTTAEEFELLISVMSGGAMEYHERSSPRSQVHGTIYTSTDHPADQRIFLHNEQSYNLTFPRKIFFFCMAPAELGGETPIADCRKVFDSLAPSIRERFMERGYL